MTRIRPGLCSVTLRAETVDTVARIAAECGLTDLEWGGDVHVPPGDSAAIARAAAATHAAGARIASYGSYAFALGAPSPTEQEELLDTVVALGAPNVRVWATFGTEPGAPDAVSLAEELRGFVAEAADRDVTVSFEYHGGTATATVAGTRALLDAVAAPNVFTYWQPPYWREHQEPAADAAEVSGLADRLSHLHVYQWAGPEERRALAEGADRWRAVLGAATAAGEWSGDRIAFIEFVAGDDPDALRRDAAVLRTWLADLDDVDG